MSKRNRSGAMQRLLALGARRRIHGVNHLADIHQPRAPGIKECVRGQATNFGHRPLAVVG
jgi:hypothetical protein